MGLAIGAYGLTQALFQIPFGLLSDRIGRKPVIVGGLVLFAIGSVVAACTNVTTSGEGFSVVINQPAPTSCIHVPMLLIRVAAQRSANALWPNGDQAETVALRGAVAVLVDELLT